MLVFSKCQHKFYLTKPLTCANVCKAMTLDCANTEGKTFTSKDQMGQLVIRRMNQITDRICEIKRRFSVALFTINQYCEITFESSSSSSSSSSTCLTVCSCEEVIEELIFITNEVANDDDVQELLGEIETELCNLYRDLKELEEDAPINCVPSSSSSEFFSSSSSSSSSSNSSSSSSSSSSFSSSSSSSSSSSEECLKFAVTLFSECPELSADAGITLWGYPSDDGYGPWEYTEIDPSSSSSSSSSSGIGGPGSSSYFTTGFSMHFNTVANTWEIYLSGVLITSISGDPCNPYGIYPITTGPCAGYTIIIE